MAAADDTAIAANSQKHNGPRIGVVVIGRNEGDRLRRCLVSLEDSVCSIVYVDSGSTDDSVALARGRSVDVVVLDMRLPFTAARARNAGFDRLRTIAPVLQYVQFVDGDCEVNSEWLSVASRFLDSHPEVVVVAGRLRERHPEASVYNMLCDMEWDAPAGESKTCGGIAMMRVVAFDAVKGFNAELICGEEPELCSRLRAQGGQVWRLTNEMALHDANMLQFGQWWTRSVRAGYSFAQAVFVDAASSNGRGRNESRSALLWAFVIPILSVGVILVFGVWGATILLVYPLQFLRIASRGKRIFKENCVRAFFLILGKFPELQGQTKYCVERLTGRKSGLIEHK